MDILVTKRLTLRPPLEVDADDIALHLSNWNVTRMLARVPFPYDHQDAIEWFKRCDEAGDEKIIFTIHRERLIGVVGIEQRGIGPVLGYWLAEPWWGHGYMSEAVGAVLGHYFDELPEATVHASVFADNPASLALQKRLGFRVTGGGEQYSTARQAMVGDIHTELTAQRFTGSNCAAYDVAA